ncbi:hypothetical protein AAC387_Pa02g1831 [Persea americana]
MPNHEIESSRGERSVNPDHAPWIRTDRMVKGWITATLTEEVLALVVDCVNSADIWQALVDAFARDSEFREFDLLQQLQLLKRGNNSMDDYLHHFKSVIDNLSAIGKLINDRTNCFVYFVDLVHSMNLSPLLC